LLLLVTLPLRAQLPSLTFETLTARDGLPGNTVFTATKDRQGFMWFGTRRCPTRYDGTSFRSFLDFETNFVTGLAADSANNLWAATDRSGVCRIAAHALHMQAVARPPTGDRRTTGNFFIHSGGQGWYGDFDGVNRLDLKTGRWKHYAFRQTHYVWVKGSFLEDGRRNLWVLGTDNGLFRYDPAGDSLRCVLGADCPDPARREPIVFTRGCTDAEGILWLGTQSHGLVRYDPRTGAYRAFRPRGRSGQISDVEEGWDETGGGSCGSATRKARACSGPTRGSFTFSPACSRRRTRCTTFSATARTASCGCARRRASSSTTRGATSSAP
jgi:ligand-binding sensor domain-containing protein